MQTFLWHDYETWGANPAHDRPCQFAAIRTDFDLNPVGEPLMVFAKPHRDYLPHPQAALVTGISPQHAEQNGVVEAEFIRQIQAQMMQPGTCSVGYNSLRFDDEVTRFTLYRNFYDAYEREYRNGNSRWDLIDVVRFCAVARPEGIVWPKDDDGLPSFRLENLTAANGIEQQGAHDALVDVRATIDLARLVKQHQPKLFDYALSLRDKHKVSQLLAVGSMAPVFHVSGMFGAKNACASVVVPLCMHPTNKNEVICYDLRHDPAPFLELGVDELKLRLFSSNAELERLAGERGEEALARFPIKNIHINKCPMVASFALLKDTAVCQRASLSPEVILQHLEKVKSWSTLADTLTQLFASRQFEQATDPDVMLYGGGFFSYSDKSQMQAIHKAQPDALASQSFVFEDQRLPEMLFRYRARNYPETLNQQERAQWLDYCRQVLITPTSEKRLGFSTFDHAVAELSEKTTDPRDLTLLREMDAWKRQILAELELEDPLVV